MRRLIIGLVFAILVAIFAAQNNRPLAIHFLFWQFPRISEALVIIASVLLGAVLGALLALRERIRRSKLTPAPLESSGPSPESTENP